MRAGGKRPMGLSRPTLVALVALAAWFGLDFIGVPRLVYAEPPVSLAGLMLAVLITLFVAGLLGLRYTAPVYALALTVWSWLQVSTHWSTYLLPAPQSKLEWYERVFGDNFRFLPALPDRTTPDAYHTVLALLILTNLVLAIRDVWRGPTEVGIST